MKVSWIWFRCLGHRTAFWSLSEGLTHARTDSSFAYMKTAFQAVAFAQDRIELPDRGATEAMGCAV
jgi:hypothetical protein